MAKDALLLSWNREIPGHAAAAGEMFAAWGSYLTKHVDSGKIERFLPVMFNSGHYGEINGFFLIEGERDKLETLRWTDDFQNLTMQTLHCVQNFRIIPAWIGEATAEAMQRWSKYAK